MSGTSVACCVCMEEIIYYLSLDEYDLNNVKYIDKLRVCIRNEDWEKSFKICLACVEKLDNAYNFVELCMKSEQFRKQLISFKDEKLEDAQEFICDRCNKSFKLKRTLRLHITRIHTRPKKNARKKYSKGEPSEDIINNVVVKTEEEKLVANDLKANIDPRVHTEAIASTTENKNDVKEDIENFNDYEVDTRDYSTSSSEDEVVVKKRKPYTRKKRGPKFKTPHKCQYCELEFARSDRYIHHVRSKHTFEKPFGCELCDSKYYSQHNLNIHMRKHRNEKPFVCSTCGKCFVSSNDLWQHNKIHDVVRQYACDECCRSFKTHSNLRTHKLQMHQDPGSWKFVCTVCGKKFPLNNNLIKHMRRHEGIKDFECHLCDKKFVEKVDLQSHILSHSDEKHFQCSVCRKEYKKKETLRRHLKIEHNMGNFVVKKPVKKLNCPLCAKTFAFNNKLQRHILTHTGEKPVKCDCCDKRFRDNYDRNNHLRQVHNIESKNSLLLL